ncbi:beta-propeller domain-containing protein, methanol dehydrogenase [Rivularia sp. PCC 7116]|uniref:photosystem II repair protein Psb32 n=1 Tax=Rivularia sp. PCC 7116 TaxID=373994 RepID=UPI00029EF349|nr:TPM domain-containing protein [Rivularia sp. PCC 7116]AFY55589.1 beta-propeller domain-containing protein, methanol dehydrogenase [Rivularia sp. PCC 7116]
MKKLLSHFLGCKKYIAKLIVSLAMIVFVSSMFSIPALATGVYNIPNLTSDTWIVDEADLISRFNEGKIISAFDELAKQTGNEVRIVTIRRLDYGETPESFTKALFEKWFPSKEAQANQTLLMIDSVTNGTAIITGDKVKSIMPDDIAQSVASETVQVPLRNGNKYNQAILDAKERLVAVLSGEPDPGPPEVTNEIQVEGTFTKAEDTDQGNATAWVVGLLIAATVIPMATYYIYLVFQPSSEG